MSRLALVVPALVALTARLMTGPHVIDDAYITFRYARNLAEGMGLVYNPGEWVLGTTAPLWAIVLAAGYRLGLTDLPWLATAISAMCDAASAAIIAHLALRMGWRAVGAALVGLAWALNPMSIAFATGGMETSLFVLMALAALSLAAAGLAFPLEGRTFGTHRSGGWPLAWPPFALAAALSGVATLVRPEGARSTVATLMRPEGARSTAEALSESATVDRQASTLLAAAALSGVATLVRPEGALLTLVILACAWVARGRRAWTAVLAAAVPMAIAGATLYLRYGSPLPNSVAAKQVAYQRGWPLENAVALLLQAGLPGWSTYLLAVVPGTLGLALSILGLATLIELTRRGLPRLNRQTLAWQPFAAFATLYVAFYVLVGLRGVRLFPWYLVPVEPFYLLAAAAGLTSVSAALGRTALATTSLGALLVAWQLPAIDWHQPLLPAGEDLGREQLYLDVGRGLATQLPPGALIAAPEIGALGYASNLRVLDTVGLISPAALPYYPLPADQLVTDNAIPARLIDDRQPDAVVTLDAFAQRSLLPDPTFQRDYYLEAEYPTNVWQSNALLLYRRAEAP